MYHSTSFFTAIKKIMSLINDRFIDHGSRVAYICYRMSLCDSDCPAEDLTKLVRAALVHDIGACKTEEIEDLLHFEVTNSLPHSVYGYLFIKYFSSISSLADVILYHHLPYENAKIHTLAHEKYIFRIHLADRIDILAHWYNDRDSILYAIESRVGIAFSPEEFALFQEADARYNILAHIEDGSYEKELAEYYNGLTFSAREIENLIKMLAFTIDFRSEQTITHTIQVAHFAKLLGAKSGLSAEMQEKLYFAGLLHDFGKIKVPVAILEKNGPLTESEWPVMKHHAQWTREILDRLVTDEIRELAARHHEKLNGSGYPERLTEEQLSYPERLMAVADITSALAGKRSYKEKMPREVIVSILEEMTQEGLLDKRATELMTKHYEEFIAAAAGETGEAARRYEALKSEYATLINRYKSLDDQFYATNEQLFADLTASEQLRGIYLVPHRAQD